MQIYSFYSDLQHLYCLNEYLLDSVTYYTDKHCTGKQAQIQRRIWRFNLSPFRSPLFQLKRLAVIMKWRLLLSGHAAATTNSTCKQAHIVVQLRSGNGYALISILCQRTLPPANGHVTSLLLLLMLFTAICSLTRLTTSISIWKCVDVTRR